VDRRHAIFIPGERIWITVFKQALDYMLVSSQYSLIQRHFSSRIHTGIPLFENVAQYGKIFKSPSRQKIAQKALLIQQDIHIKVMVRQEDPCRLDIRVVAGQV
jgi:hypothetical protein